MATDTGVRAKEGRRAALLAAAREVLAEKGLDAAKVSDIVARAGVAQGTFYLYFPSKFSLVIALAEDMDRRILAATQEAVARAQTLAEGIDVGVAVAFEEMGRYRDVLGIIEARIGLVELRAQCAHLYQEYYAYVAGMIEQGQASGEVDRAVNPAIAARLIVGVLERAAEECYVLGQHAPDEDYVTEVARFVKRGLGMR
ncbi:MAG TPA: TetR family transcriptional regulator [Ktedonobacterales bacterium]|nr:TetR family transcriptional regulator [Ktedonobacterales bacterium]